MYDWAIFISDAVRPEMNAAAYFPSALPEFVRSGRAAVPAETAATRPSPVGVIRLAGGRPADGGKVDVLLQVKGGKFAAHWPPSKSRSDRLLWDDLDLTAVPDGAEELRPGHWYAALRDGTSAFLRRGGRAERFLLYDAELNLPNPLRLTLPDRPMDAYRAANTGAAALHDVQVYKPADGGWRLAELAKLDGSGVVPPAAAPATSPTGPRPTAPSVTPSPAPAVATGPTTGPATAPSSPATGASTRPTTGPSTAPAGVGTPFAGDRPRAAADALAPWREKLAAAGLPAADLPLILAILEQHALDPRRTTVVYRLDPAEMDRLLPLEVTPTPRRTVRVGLVILRNAGPELKEEVDRLIAQLGDEAWAKREEAQRQLSQLGPVAMDKLRAAQSNKDLEIAWRAERLLKTAEPAAK